jgi:hypothetical protein
MTRKLQPNWSQVARCSSLAVPRRRARGPLRTTMPRGAFEWFELLDGRAATSDRILTIISS